MNVVALTGNMGKDFELRYSPSGTAVAKGTLAVKGSMKEQNSDEYKTNWIMLLAFGKRAETLCNYVKKGDRLSVSGEISTGSYEGQDGKRVYTTEILINSFDLPPRSESGQANNQQQNQQHSQTTNNQQNYTRVDEDPFSNSSGPIEVSDDDLPF